MKVIYFDNGSTSFPKAPGMGDAIGEHIDNNGYNISRGGYGPAYGVEATVIEAKELLCKLFNGENARNVVFTPGATASLNMILKGLLHKGDHVVTSSMEHNAVVRPLTQLLDDGVEWSAAQCNSEGELDASKIEGLLKPNTKLVLVTHASNVCGTLLPIKEIGEICNRNNVFFAVDAAQSAGSEDIDMKECFIDALAFPGHKSLLGPQGIGGMLLSKTIANEMKPLIAGGTGSVSDKEVMPDFLPDKFQAGTLNIPGIIGLNHALKYIEEQGLENIRNRKRALTEIFLEGIEEMDTDKVRLVGKLTGEGRCSVVSLDFKSIDNAEVSFVLESQYGIMTRCGLHCAPHAHKTLGTFPNGTVRFSLGHFNTEEEIASVISAIKGILKR